MNPIICAIDIKDIDRAKWLCKMIQPNVGMVKLGLEFFIANGPNGVEAIAKMGTPIFLDLKLHDIPNTVAEAVRAAVQLDVAMLTLHTSGGANMIAKAAEVAKEEAVNLGRKAPLLVGVTVLTSMDQDDLQSVGVERDVSEQVKSLALLAKSSGLDGIVCSAHEIDIVKQACGVEFKTVVPGIRPASSSLGDQKRVMTPKEAIGKGADFLVIGRPITQSEDPIEASQALLQECAA